MDFIQLSYKDKDLHQEPELKKELLYVYNKIILMVNYLNFMIKVVR